MAEFHALHQARFAYADPAVAPEIVTLRLCATGRLAKPGERPCVPDAAATPEAKGRRQIFVDGAWREAAVYERAALVPGHALAGPLLIDERHATHFVPAGWRLAALAGGALVASGQGETT